MTSQTFNIIGDVAGQYKTLIALLAKMPEASKAILVGDLIDRGPNSRKVVQFVKNNHGYIMALKGNHEDMMCDFVLSGRPGSGFYSREDWLVNGGGATVRSYLPNAPTRTGGVSYPHITEALMGDAQFLAELPLYFKTDGLFVSHAPVTDLETVDRPTLDFLWNRTKPRQMPGHFIVHGHNAIKNVMWYHDRPAMDVPGWVDKPWGINIDTSRADKLTGINWPSMELFEQEYIG